MPGGASQATVSAEDYRLLLGLDFMTFAQRAFYEQRPESAFEPHPYLELLASRLEDFRLGKIRRPAPNSFSGLAPTPPGPPISFGTTSFTSTEPSSERAAPSRPPVALALVL